MKMKTNLFFLGMAAAVITEVPTEMNIHTVAPQETTIEVIEAGIIKDHRKKIQDIEVDQGIFYCLS